MILRAVFTLLLLIFKIGVISAQALHIKYITQTTQRNPLPGCDTLDFYCDPLHSFTTECEGTLGLFNLNSAYNTYYDFDSLIVHKFLLKTRKILRDSIYYSPAIKDSSAFSSILMDNDFIKTKNRAIIAGHTCSAYMQKTELRASNYIYWIADSVWLPHGFVTQYDTLVNKKILKRSSFPSFLGTGRLILGVDQTYVHPRTYNLVTKRQRAVAIMKWNEFLPAPQFLISAYSENFTVVTSPPDAISSELMQENLTLYRKEFFDDFFPKD